MVHQIIFRVESKLLFYFLVFIQLVNISVASGQTPTKKISPWYIYKEGSSFDDLAPYKKIISSVSVFGNPSKEFIDECHKNGILVYHGVSGKEKDIDTPEKIEAVANEYVNTCKLKGYDGIDLDYEQLEPKFQGTYSEFLRVVSSKLHHSGRKLSHCVGFYPSLSDDTIPHIFYDPKVVAETCDLVRVMCYDMYYAPNRANGIGPTSTYPWTRDAMNYWMKYVPRNKLVMGLPAYSNDYAMTLNGTGRQISSDVPDVDSSSLPSPTWLWYERINIYLYKAPDGDIHLFYASDAKSTKNLLELGDELGIHTIGFWHFGSVSPQMWLEVKEWEKK